MRLGAIYLDDYAGTEWERVIAHGVAAPRLRLEDILRNVSGGSLDRSKKYVVRGKRMDAPTFESLWRAVNAAGARLATSPRAFAIGERFAEQQTLLGNLSPRAVTADLSVAASELALTLAQAEMALPLFVRSEIESAAKHVGLEGCILRSGDRDDIDRILTNLRRYVPMARTVIVKELLPIETHHSKPLEYRAIGLGGALLCFDRDSSQSDVPPPEDVGLVPVAASALTRLAEGGADGGLFVDVALTTAKTGIVVECKNLLNGTIKNVAAFAAALAAQP